MSDRQGRESITEVERLIQAAKIHKLLINLFKHSQSGLKLSPQHQKFKNEEYITVTFYDGCDPYIFKITATKIEWLLDLEEKIIYSYILVGTNLYMYRSNCKQLSKLRVKLSDLVW